MSARSDTVDGTATAVMIGTVVGGAHRWRVTLMSGDAVAAVAEVNAHNGAQAIILACTGFAMDAGILGGKLRTE